LLSFYSLVHIHVLCAFVSPINISYLLIYFKVIAASDGFVRLAQDDGTLEFKNRASSRLIRDDTKG